MIFTLGSISITLESPAQYPFSKNVMLMQARELSASGFVHVEDFNVQSTKKTYVFEDMNDTDYINLMSFFVNTAQGMLNPFTLTDDIGGVSTVRFSTPDLSNFSKTSFQLWAGSITVEDV